MGGLCFPATLGLFTCTPLWRRCWVLSCSPTRDCAAGRTLSSFNTRLLSLARDPALWSWVLGLSGAVWNVSPSLARKVLLLRPKETFQVLWPLGLLEAQFPSRLCHRADSAATQTVIRGDWRPAGVTGNLSAPARLFIEEFIGFFHNSREENQTNVTSYYHGN